MKLNYKKLAFVALDIVVLGFFGLYLALNVKYRDDIKTADFRVQRLLDNTSGNTPTPKPKPACTSLSSSNGCTGSYSKDGTCSVSSIQYGPSGCTSSGTLSCTVSGSGLGTCSISGSTATFTSTYTGSSSKCKETATITISNGSLSTTATATVYVPWGTSEKSECIVKGSQISRTDAENKDMGKYHTSPDPNKYCPGENNVGYKYVTRGCGKTPPVPQWHCYKDSNGFLWYALKEERKQDTAGEYYIQDNKPSGWTIAKDANGKEIDPKQCYTKFKCSTNYASGRTVETACNGTHEPTSEPGTQSNELSGVYTKKCGILYGSTIGSKKADGTESQLFYKITCKETMRTAFNGPIFNNDNSFMYPGTGFGFNYFAKTKVACEGKWDNAFYTAAEKYIKDYISKNFNNSSFQQDDENGKINTAFYDSATSALSNVATSYKNWKVDYYGLGKPSATINDIQPDGKVGKKDWHLFNLVFEELATEGSSSCGELPNGTLKPSFTYQELHNIRMKLPTLWYDKSAKYVSEIDNQYKVKECTSSDPNCLGRIFPVSDSKEFVGTDYKYKVNVSGLGMSHNWTNHETCNIIMKTKDVYFRQINLSDPFVQKLNPDRGIGYNWKNSKFSFVNLIDPNIWNKTSEYNMIRITEEDGKNIKTELNTNKGYYTGICSSGSASTASTICAKYNQAVNGK